MANTYTLIASNTLSSSAASVTFSAIPATYTDLVLRYSARSSHASNTVNPYVRFNGVSSTVYSRTTLYGTGSGGAGSGRLSNFDKAFINGIPAANATSNSFGNAELYLPNYNSNTNKPFSSFNVVEYNSATVDENINLIASLYSQTAAITSLEITPFYGSFVSGSSFFLYGISSS